MEKYVGVLGVAMLCASAVAQERLVTATVNVQDVHTIAKHRMQMQPKNDFEKWQADQWSLYARHCASSAKVKLPEDFPNKLYRPGSWSLPRSGLEGSLCSALAKSAQKKEVPVCESPMSMQDPFTTPQDGLPSNYLYLSKPLNTGDSVLVSSYCALSQYDYQNTRQFFAGKGTFEWISPIRNQSIQTFSGARQLQSGTGLFRVDGAPSLSSPKMIILVKK